MNHPRARERIVVRTVERERAESLARELSVPAPIAAIMVGRGLHSFDQCKRFFRPDLSALHDPFLFTGMDRAADRIVAAARAGEKIAIFGDYDVDGVTSTAMLVRLLRELGADCAYYLPNRLTEGYGLSEKGVRELAGIGARLVVTVDCGISAAREVALARDLGMDIIVTDHHEPKEHVPDALVVLDPKMDNCGYPDRDLAGVGVALKLAQALVRRTGGSDDLWRRYLDLAALGTAADIVPLTGENRLIARFGFERMRSTANAGLRALVSARGLDGRELSTSQVVFMLAPCINAAGRLGDPRRGVELLLTDDPGLAGTYARELVSANEERRALDSRVQEQAFEWIENHVDLEREFGVVAGSPAWHCGVIGIVASKVVERYHRPAILFSLGDDGMARGSGRSIARFHLLDALTECSSLLESYGGHAAAAGMSIRCDAIERFRTRFNEVARARLSADDLVPTVMADAEVRMTDLTPVFLNIVKQMEPFGPGNMRPVLYCRDLRHRYDPRVVGANHLKLSVTDGATVMDAIGFDLGDRIGDLRAAPRFSLAFSLDENEWNGRTSLQMKLKGVAS